MKIDFTHLALLVVVVLALVACVVLTLAGQSVPDAVTGILVAGGGAIFGVTLPARAGGAPADEQ
jgi:hypothetical protein